MSVVNDQPSRSLKSILENLHFSAELPAVVIDRLAESAALRDFAADEIVFREGSTSEFLYVVDRGRVALDMTIPGRGAARILTIGPGEMFGWSALLDQGKMTTHAVAVEDSTAVAIPAEPLRRLCESNHDFGYYLMRQMASALSKRLVATRLQLLDLFGG